MIANLTWGADFAGLVRYLMENRDHEVLALQGVSSIDLAADEMAAVASLNDRATNKLLHLSLSAAIEDGQLGADQWLQAVDRHEETLGLRNHQRVVVRHSDKEYDHVHVFWCTISIQTGQTPPKQWFLRKGCAVQSAGPHALSEAQVAAIPVTDRARRTYDFRALARCQDTCRQLECELNLRRLRTPTEAAAARIAGENGIDGAAQRKRAERVGSIPLVDRADEIRAALETPDWPSKRRALAAIGLDLEPTFRHTRKGTELRGLVIYDAADHGNRIKASALDTPAMKYGCRRLEERHDTGALSFESWWRGCEPSAPAAVSRHGEVKGLKEDFDLLCERHRFNEREKKERRKVLRRKQAAERANKQRELMERRRLEASRLRRDERRAFYKLFSATIRSAELTALAERHKLEAIDLSRTRKPTWIEFVAARANAGCEEANAVMWKHKTISSKVTTTRRPAIERSDEPERGPSVADLPVRPREEEVAIADPLPPSEMPADLHLQWYFSQRSRTR